MRTMEILIRCPKCGYLNRITPLSWAGHGFAYCQKRSCSERILYRDRAALLRDTLPTCSVSGSEEVPHA
jgi:DNA-directed RNA polymerase subunit RPC12/RpoP